MRKSILLVVCAVLLSINTLSAQIKIGPDLGLNLAPLDAPGGGNLYKTGLNGGVRTDFDLGQGLGLRTGLYYTEKGQAFDSVSVGSLLDEYSALFELIDIGEIVGGDLSEAGIKLDINRTYEGLVTGRFIEIPLQVTYQTGKVQFSLGGYAAYMIAAERQTTINEQTPVLQILDLDAALGGFGGLLGNFLPPVNETREEITTGTDAYNAFDYGIKGGISFISEEGLGFNLSYQHGLQDYRAERPDDANFEAFKNMILTISYQWGIDKK